MNALVLAPFVILGIILAVLSFVLKKKHSEFPDFSVGYHHQAVTESKEKWEHANRAAGNLCAGFAAIIFLVCALLCCLNAATETALALLIFVSVIAILCILIVPAKLAQKL